MGPDTLGQLETLVASIRNDYTKAKAGNKAAAVRVRKAMSEVKKAAQAVRVEMSELKTAE